MRRLIDDRTPPHLGSALDPIDIISRASGYVPSAESQTRRVSVKPGRAAIINETPDDFDTDMEATTVVLPTARSRRRPLRLALARARTAFGYGARYGTALAVFVALPLWLWSSGNLETVAGFADREFRLWKAWATQEFGLRVESVRVQGRDRTDPAALLDAMGVQRGSPMLDIDVEEVRHRIETLPWVSEATVERRLPNRLVVRIEERRAIARLQNGDAVHLVARDGTIIESAAGEQDSDLMLLSGPDAAETLGALMLLLVSRPELGERVIAAERVGGRRWDLRFDSGVIVRLPAEFAPAAWGKLEDLQASHGLLDLHIAVLDMRLPDRLILTPRPDETEDAGAAAGEGTDDTGDG